MFTRHSKMICRGYTQRIFETLRKKLLQDGDGNRIKQWNRPSMAHGIFSSELELSQSPVLGNWKIIANVGDQTFEKEFEVAEYILPNFEVTIDSPKHVQFKESKIMATIHAR